MMPCNVSMSLSALARIFFSGMTVNFSQKINTATHFNGSNVSQKVFTVFLFSACFVTVQYEFYGTGLKHVLSKETLFSHCLRISLAVSFETMFYLVAAEAQSGDSKIQVACAGWWLFELMDHFRKSTVQEVLLRLIFLQPNSF